MSKSETNLNVMLLFFYGVNLNLKLYTSVVEIIELIEKQVLVHNVLCLVFTAVFVSKAVCALCCPLLATLLTHVAPPLTESDYGNCRLYLCAGVVWSHAAHVSWFWQLPVALVPVPRASVQWVFTVFLPF